MGRISSLGAGVPIALLTVLVACTPVIQSAPVQETSLSRHTSGKGCYYMNKLFPSGQRIETNEPCLNCTCVDSTFMCYLRVCPFVKPVDEHCVSEMHVGDCCPKFWCPEVYPRVTTQRPDTEPRGCVVDGRYYEEGARIPMNPLKPCEACYCIRNTSVCTMQTCELQVEGCFPQYKAGSCCPSRYNCTNEAATTIPPGIMEPEDYEGCRVGDMLYKDGESVPSENNCETCYCMKHAVACAIHKCHAPSDSCVPGEIEPGQCCPTKYECPPTTEVPEWYSTLSPIEEDSTSNISLTTGIEHKSTTTVLRSLDTSTQESTLLTEQDSETTTRKVIEQSTKGSLPEEILIGVTDAPGVADTSIITETPKITEMSEVTKTPEVAETSKTTLALEATETSKFKEPLDVSETTKVEATSDVSETSKITEPSKVTETSEVSEIADVTEISKITETSVVTETSKVNETSEISEASDVTETSKVTEFSGVTDAAVDVVSRSREPKITEVPDDFFTSSTTRPVFLPSRPGEGIPGEGVCRHGNRTYKPNEKVSSLDPCRRNCMCVNSVWRCEIFEECVVTTRKNCKIIPVDGECCPKIVCDDDSKSGQDDLKTIADEVEITTIEIKKFPELELTKTTPLSLQEEVSLDAESFTRPSTKPSEEAITMTEKPSTDIEHRLQVSTVTQVTTIESEKTSVDELESITTPPTEQKEVSLVAEDITKSTLELSTESPLSTDTTKIEPKTPTSTLQAIEDKSVFELHVDTTASILTEQEAEEVTDTKDSSIVTSTEEVLFIGASEVTKEPIAAVTSSESTEEVKEINITSTTFTTSTIKVSEIKLTTKAPFTTDSPSTSQSTTAVTPTKDEETTLLDLERIETRPTIKSTTQDEHVTITSTIESSTSKPTTKTAQSTTIDAMEVTIKDFVTTAHTSIESTLVTKPVSKTTEQRTTLEEIPVEKTTEVSTTKSSPTSVISEDETHSTEAYASTKFTQTEFDATTSKPALIITDRDSIDDKKIEEIPSLQAHNLTESVTSEDSKISTDEYSTTVTPMKILTEVYHETDTVKDYSQDKDVTSTTQILGIKISTEISDLQDDKGESTATDVKQITTEAGTTTTTLKTTDVISLEEVLSTQKPEIDVTETSHNVTEDSDRVKETETVTTSAPLTSEEVVTHEVTFSTIEPLIGTSKISLTDTPSEEYTVTTQKPEEVKSSTISEIESTSIETAEIDQEIEATTLRTDTDLTKVTSLEAETTPSTKEQTTYIALTTQTQKEITEGIDTDKTSSITGHFIESTLLPVTITEGKVNETSDQTAEIEAGTISVESFTETMKSSPPKKDTSLTTSKSTDQEDDGMSSPHSVDSETTPFLSVDDSSTLSQETSSFVSEESTPTMVPTTGKYTGTSDGKVTEKEEELSSQTVTITSSLEDKSTEVIKAIIPDTKTTTVEEDFTIVTVTDSSPKEVFAVASLNRTQEETSDTILDTTVTESIQTVDIQLTSTVSSLIEKSTPSPTVLIATASETFEDEKSEISSLSIKTSTETPSTASPTEQKTTSSQTTESILEAKVTGIDSTSESKEITTTSKLLTKTDEITTEISSTSSLGDIEVKTLSFTTSTASDESQKPTSTSIDSFTTITKSPLSNVTEIFVDESSSASKVLSTVSEKETTLTKTDKLTTVSDQNQTEEIKGVSESDSIFPRIPISTDNLETTSMAGITEIMESQTETIDAMTEISGKLSTTSSKTMLTESFTSEPSTSFGTTASEKEISAVELTTVRTLMEEMPTSTSETIKSEETTTIIIHTTEPDTSTSVSTSITEDVTGKSTHTLTFKTTEPEEDIVSTDSTAVTESGDEKTLFETSTKRETLTILKTTEKPPITISEAETASLSSFVTMSSEITDDTGKLTTHQDVTTSISDIDSTGKTPFVASITEIEKLGIDTTVFVDHSLPTTTVQELTESRISDIPEIDAESTTAKVSTSAEDVELLVKKTTIAEDSTLESKSVVPDKIAVTKSTDGSTIQSTVSDKTTITESKEELSTATNIIKHDSSMTEAVTPKVTVLTSETTKIDTLQADFTSESTAFEITQEPKTPGMKESTFAPEEIKILEITQDQDTPLSFTTKGTLVTDYIESTSEQFTTKISEDIKTVTSTLKDASELEKGETIEPETVTALKHDEISTLKVETSKTTEKSTLMDVEKISVLPESITVATSITSTADLFEPKFTLTTVEEGESTSVTTTMKSISTPVPIETFEEDKTSLRPATETSISETKEPTSEKTTMTKEILKDEKESSSTFAASITETTSMKPLTTEATEITSIKEIKTTGMKQSETTITKSLEVTTKEVETTSSKSIETTFTKPTETTSTDLFKTTVPSRQFTSEPAGTIIDLTTESPSSLITSDDISTGIFESKFTTSTPDKISELTTSGTRITEKEIVSATHATEEVTERTEQENIFETTKSQTAEQVKTSSVTLESIITKEEAMSTETIFDHTPTQISLTIGPSEDTETSFTRVPSTAGETTLVEVKTALTERLPVNFSTGITEGDEEVISTSSQTTSKTTTLDSKRTSEMELSTFTVLDAEVSTLTTEKDTDFKTPSSTETVSEEQLEVTSIASTIIKDDKVKDLAIDETTDLPTTEKHDLETTEASVVSEEAIISNITFGIDSMIFTHPSTAIPVTTDRAEKDIITGRETVRSTTLEVVTTPRQEEIDIDRKGLKEESTQLDISSTDQTVKFISVTTSKPAEDEAHSEVSISSKVTLPEKVFEESKGTQAVTITTEKSKTTPEKITEQQMLETTITKLVTNEVTGTESTPLTEETQDVEHFSVTENFIKDVDVTEGTTKEEFSMITDKDSTAGTKITKDEFSTLTTPKEFEITSKETTDLEEEKVTTAIDAFKTSEVPTVSDSLPTEVTSIKPDRISETLAAETTTKFTVTSAQSVATETGESEKSTQHPLTGITEKSTVTELPFSMKSTKVGVTESAPTSITKEAGTEEPKLSTTQVVEIETPKHTTTQASATEEPKLTTMQVTETGETKEVTTLAAATKEPKLTTMQVSETEEPKEATTEADATEELKLTTIQEAEMEESKEATTEAAGTKEPKLTTMQVAELGITKDAATLAAELEESKRLTTIQTAKTEEPEQSSTLKVEAEEPKQSTTQIIETVAPEQTTTQASAKEETKPLTIQETEKIEKSTQAAEIEKSTTYTGETEKSLLLTTQAVKTEEPKQTTTQRTETEFKLTTTIENVTSEAATSKSPDETEKTSLPTRDEELITEQVAPSDSVSTKDSSLDDVTDLTLSTEKTQFTDVPAVSEKELIETIKSTEVSEEKRPSSMEEDRTIFAVTSSIEIQTTELSAETTEIFAETTEISAETSKAPVSEITTITDGTINTLATSMLSEKTSVTESPTEEEHVEEETAPTSVSKSKEQEETIKKTTEPLTTAKPVFTTEPVSTVTESTSSTATTTTESVTKTTAHVPDIELTTIPETEIKSTTQQTLEISTIEADAEEKDECIVNGTTYGDGVSIRTIEPCERCHCAAGEIVCFKIICKLPIKGCVAETFFTDECCPSTYKCPADDGSMSTISVTDAQNVTEKDFTTPIPISFMFSTSPSTIHSTKLITISDEMAPTKPSDLFTEFTEESLLSSKETDSFTETPKLLSVTETSQTVSDDSTMTPEIISKITTDISEISSLSTESSVTTESKFSITTPSATSTKPSVVDDSTHAKDEVATVVEDSSESPTTIESKFSTTTASSTSMKPFVEEDLTTVKDEIVTVTEDSSESSATTERKLSTTTLSATSMKALAEEDSTTATDDVATVVEDDSSESLTTTESKLSTATLSVTSTKALAEEDSTTAKHEVTTVVEDSSKSSTTAESKLSTATLSVTSTKALAEEDSTTAKDEVVTVVEDLSESSATTESKLSTTTLSATSTKALAEEDSTTAKDEVVTVAEDSSESSATTESKLSTTTLSATSTKALAEEDSTTAKDDLITTESKLPSTTPSTTSKKDIVEENLITATDDVVTFAKASSEISAPTESETPSTTSPTTSTMAFVKADSTTAEDEVVTVVEDSSETTFKSTVTETEAALTTLVEKPSVKTTSDTISETVLSRSGTTQASTLSVEVDTLKVKTTLSPTELVTTVSLEDELSSDSISDIAQTSSQTVGVEKSTFEVEKITTDIPLTTVPEKIDITSDVIETSKTKEQKITTVDMEINTSTVSTFAAETTVAEKSTELSSAGSTKAADVTLTTPTPAKLPKMDDSATTTMRTTVEGSTKEQVFTTAKLSEKTTTEEISKPIVQESTTAGLVEKGRETLSTLDASIDTSVATSLQSELTSLDSLTNVPQETTIIPDSTPTFVEFSSVSISTDKSVIDELHTTKALQDIIPDNISSTMSEFDEILTETQESTKKVGETTPLISAKPEGTSVTETVTEHSEVISTTPRVEEEKTTKPTELQMVTTLTSKTAISDEERKDIIASEKEQSLLPLTTSQGTTPIDDLKDSTKPVVTEIPKTTFDEDKILKPDELLLKETSSEIPSTFTISENLHTLTQEAETTESFESFTEIIETNKTISSLSKEGTTFPDIVTNATIFEPTDKLLSTTKESPPIQTQTQTSIDETKSTDSIFKFVTSRFTDKEKETTLSEELTKTTILTPSQLFTSTPKVILTTKGPSIKSLDTDSPFMQESTITQSVVTQPDALVSQSITFPETASGNGTEKSDFDVSVGFTQEETGQSSTLSPQTPTKQIVKDDKELTISTLSPAMTDFTSIPEITTPEDILSTKKDEEQPTVITEHVTESVAETKTFDTKDISVTTEAELLSTSPQISLSSESFTQSQETTIEEKTSTFVDRSSVKEILPESTLVTKDSSEQFTSSEALDAEPTTKIELEALSVSTSGSQLDEAASQKEINSTAATDIIKFTTESASSSISDSSTDGTSPDVVSDKVISTTSIVKINETSDSTISTVPSTTMTESSIQTIQFSETTVSDEITSTSSETTKADVKIITDELITSLKEDTTAQSINLTQESDTTLSSIISTVTVPSIELGPPKLGTTSEENVFNITESSTEVITQVSTERATEISTMKVSETFTESATEGSTVRDIEPPMRKAIDAFTEQASEPTTEKAIEASTSRSPELTTARTLEASTNKSIDASTEKATEASSEETVDVSTRSISESSTGVPLVSTERDTLASKGTTEHFAKETSSTEEATEAITEQTITKLTSVSNITEVSTKATAEPFADERVSQTTTHSSTKSVTEMPTKAFKGIETTPTVLTTQSTATENGTATDAEEDFLLDEGACIFEGQIYHSAEQIVREDPCEFCFCFRGDIICLQQSCPPPAPNCHQTLIQGYCCPRYDCPVLVTSRNLTNLTRRKGVQPIIIQKRIEKRAARATVEVKGCQINGTFYAVGSTVAKASGPCLHCSCEEGGNMRCDPIKCKPQAPLMLKMNNQFFRHR